MCKRQEYLWRILHSFKKYYNIKHYDNVRKPFVAEAEFHLHDERYVFVRSAKIAEIYSHEFVFFAETENLTLEQLETLDAAAWQTGLSRVEPSFKHRNSDITLVIIADTIDETAKKKIKKLNHYKSYCFNFKGWSHYRVLAYELSSGQAVHNRLAANLKKVISNIN